MLFVLLAAGLLLPSAALQAQTWTLSMVTVKGTQRFDPVIVAEAAGLKKSAKVGKAQLDAACQKLAQSGLFQFCTYKFTPVSASAVNLEVHVQEAPADYGTRISIPGIEEGKLWAWLEEHEPLLQRSMPGSDEATRYYLSAVQRGAKALGSQAEIGSAVDSDLNTGKISIVFRPAHLAAIVDVRFKGNVLFTEKKLRDVLMAVASQNAFTEFDFRRLLDYNIRPLYEETGRLGVLFRDITTENASGGVIVTTTITEGAVYVLKSAKLAGEGIAEEEMARIAQLPVGKIANWRSVDQGLEACIHALKAGGYLTAKAKTERKLNDAAGTADLSVVFERGEQYTFGGLTIAGVPADLETKIRGLWQLPKGAPANEGYVDEYLRSAFRVLGKDYRSVAKEIAVRPGTRVVDVTARFGR